MSINDRTLTPKDLEPLCGFHASMLKEWRRLDMLEGIGERHGNGRWQYTLREAVQLSICNSLRLAGLPGYIAIKVAQDIHDDALKAAGFYGPKKKPGFELIAIWNTEGPQGYPRDYNQGEVSRYFPWSSYPAGSWEEIMRFIDAPAPIVVDLHKICVAMPAPLKDALREAM